MTAHENSTRTPDDAALKLNRRTLLAGAALGVAASAVSGGLTEAAPAVVTPGTAPLTIPGAPPGSTKGVGFVLSHEQFPVPQLLTFGSAAEQAGFDTVWTSDHIQPWQDNEGHNGQAWVTLAALGQRTQRIPFGTGVTCPTFRYNPAVVAQTFATLGLLHPGRVFLGLGSGEALNEQTATGKWAPWSERNARIIEAIDVTRQLWSGNTVNYNGQYYQVENMKFYDLPSQPVPIYVAANGPKAMYRSGRYGDGLITDPKMLMDQMAMNNFRMGAMDAGKNPAAMPILVESFVHVGDEAEARQVAEFWRFTPKSWDSYVNVPDPVQIRQRADSEVMIDEVIKNWTIGTDPQKHVEGINKLFSMGATQVYIHSAQPDQQKVIDFYGSQVLPKLRMS